MTGMVRLHPDDVRAIVDELAVALAAGSGSAGKRWLSTEEVARAFGRSADWVREHASELGGRKIGGPRAPWRFPATCLAVVDPAPTVAEAPLPAQRRRVSRPTVALLPIRS